MKLKSVHGLIALTRYREYLISVTIVTLLGVLSSGTRIEPNLLLRLVMILAANILSFVFPFMYNDIEDAPDDAKNPEKAKRNPLSANIVSWRLAFIATATVVTLALVLFFLINPLTFFLGFVSILLGIFYSWREVRLKSMPIMDLVSHSLMLGGLQFAAAHFAFAPYTGLNIGWIAPFILIITLSMYGELVNEVRDLYYDRKVGLTHTAALVGEQTAKILMYLLLFLAGGTIVISVLLQLIPMWVIFVAVALCFLYIRPTLSSLQKKPDLNSARRLKNPVLVVTVVSLLLWMAIRSIS